MALERPRTSISCGVDVGHQLGELVEVRGVADARDDVLTLSVEQEVARRLRRAGDLVAAERDPRAGIVAQVSVDHLLDVDRRPPVVGDPVQPPVLDRALAVPGVEHGADRLMKLLYGSAGNGPSGAFLETAA